MSSWEDVSNIVLSLALLSIFTTDLDDFMTLFWRGCKNLQQQS